MPEIERLTDRTVWVDLPFMECERTPRWAVYMITPATVEAWLERFTVYHNARQT